MKEKTSAILARLRATRIETYAYAQALSAQELALGNDASALAEGAVRDAPAIYGSVSDHFG